MSTNEKNRKKHSAQKVIVKISFNGKKISLETNASTTVNILNKLGFSNNGNNTSDAMTKDAPPQELVTEFIEKQDNFSHSMPILMEYFFGKSIKGGYQKIHKMSIEARIHLERKYNGTFRADEILPENTNKTKMKVKVWSFEPKTSPS